MKRYTIEDVVNEFRPYSSGAEGGIGCRRIRLAYNRLLSGDKRPALQLLNEWIAASTTEVNGWKPSRKFKRKRRTAEMVARLAGRAQRRANYARYVALRRVLLRTNLADSRTQQVLR